MAGGFDKERESLEAHFKAAFATALSPSVAVQFDNIPFTVPGSREWVKLTISNGESGRRAMGVNAKRRHAGVVFVQVFVPADAGTKRARIIADAVVACLQEKVIASGTDWINTLDSRFTPVGIVENGAYMATVATFYQRDES